MIDYDAHSYFGVLFRVHGSVIPRLIPRAMLFAVLGAFAAWLHQWLCGENWKGVDDCKYNRLFDGSADLHVYTSGIIGLLLVFRTNASYARYDKGVEAVGKLRVSARILVSQACAYFDCDDDTKRCDSIDEIRRLTMLYCLMFKRHVHEEDALDIDEDSNLIHRMEKAKLEACRPIMRAVLVTSWLRSRLMSAMKAGLLDENCMLLMDNTVSAMVENFQLGCRIAFIPMPFAYAQVVKWIMTLFCMVGPFAYVSDLQYATPAAAFIMALLVFAVDEIGVEIEDPFGDDDADIDLNVVLREIDEQAAELIADATNTTLHYIFAGTESTRSPTGRRKPKAQKVIPSPRMVAPSERGDKGKPAHKHRRREVTTMASLDGLDPHKGAVQ